MKIVLKQLKTPIFVMVIILSATLFALGERQDAVFVISAVTINVTIGAVQEIRARLKLKELELMSAPRAKILLPNGGSEEVDYKTLQSGDTILVETGDELPADGEITKSVGLECDESMLTGESVAVKKKLGEVVYASSAIVAGSAEVKVTAVGDNTRVGIMSAKLKNYDPQITPLQQSISRSIQYFSVLALILGGLFFIVYTYRDFPLVQIVKTITTAAVSVVPEGLLLASTLFLAYGSLRLAQVKVLPQKLSAIEGMALLNVLCVDKTGTLTSPEISFDKLTLLDKDVSRRKLARLLGVLARESGTMNSTSRALAKRFNHLIDYSVVETLPFSSGRKLSAVRVRALFRVYSIVMGAPENVSKIAPLSKKQQALVDKFSAKGLRVLLVAELPASDSLEQIDSLTGKPIALLTFSNELREGVRETIAFLQESDVSVRVISGDGPETVSHIASLAGIKDAEKTITGAELTQYKVGKADWDEVVLGSTIFARVLPEQKEKIIATFKRHGLYTGMIGDGVNDALALKSADLGIAMGSGVAATKRVSDMVLLDSAFTALPVGMKLGSQIMLAIEMVATLAFHKIFFGVGLSILTLLFGMPYPFLPRHVTFMNIFLMTLPTLIITIFTPVPTAKINPKNFWRDTAWRILPIAGLSSLGIFLAYAVTTFFSKQVAHLYGQSTVAVLTATFFGMMAVYLTNIMFKTKQTVNTKTATIAYVVASSIVAIASFGFRFARNFFNFAAPNALGAIISVAIVVLTAIVQIHIAMNRKVD